MKLKRVDRGKNEKKGVRMTGGRTTSFIVGILAGTVVGALGAIILDPVSGRRRRAYLKDKGTHYRRDFSDYAARQARDLRNRTHGLMAEARRVTHGEEAIDNTKLVERVRSEMGRKTTHPHAIHVSASDGEITLRGQILKSEVEDLIECVSQVRGVREVKNEMELHETADRIPALQGQGKESLRH